MPCWQVGSPGSIGAVSWTGLWLVKVLVLVLLLVAVFFLPYEVLLGSGVASYPFAGLFILAQLILLIDFGYQLNDFFTRRADNNPDAERRWLGLILVVGMVLLVVTGAFYGVLFYQYTVAGCSLALVLFVGTMVASIVVVLIALTDARSSILTVSVIAAFVAYTVFSALRRPSAISDECAGNARIKSVSGPASIIGVVLLVGSVLYSTFSTAQRHEAFESQYGSNTPSRTQRDDSDDKESQLVSEPPHLDAKESQLVSELPPPDGSGGGHTDDLTLVNPEDVPAPAYSPRYFFLIYLGSACYLLLVFLNWQLDSAVPDSPWVVGTSRVSLWVTMVTGWVCLVLYLWTVIAPRILVNRVFD